MCANIANPEARTHTHTHQVAPNEARICGLLCMTCQVPSPDSSVDNAIGIILVSLTSCAGLACAAVYLSLSPSIRHRRCRWLAHYFRFASHYPKHAARCFRSDRVPLCACVWFWVVHAIWRSEIAGIATIATIRRWTGNTVNRDDTVKHDQMQRLS